MVSPLVSSLAATVGKALSPIFLDATLTRDVPGVATDPADPPAPTQVSFACKAIESEYSVGLIISGLINSPDIQVMILASTLATDPQPLDRITIPAHNVAGTIVPENAGGMKAVQSDPARATWLCRCRT